MVEVEPRFISYINTCIGHRHYLILEGLLFCVVPTDVYLVNMISVVGGASMLGEYSVNVYIVVGTMMVTLLTD